MLADDVACNPRNAYPGTLFNDARHLINMYVCRRRAGERSLDAWHAVSYGEDVEVDYRGSEVTVEAFLRVLTGV